MKLILSLVFAIIAGAFAISKTPVSYNDRRVVCYYGSWAGYRQGLGNFQVENIDPYICTHAIYTFAALDANTYEIISYDPYMDLEENYGKGAYKRFTNLALINPDLKCMLAIGGWNEGSTKYSDMANDPAKRNKFVQSVVPFLKQYGFHGLDMDWEYPTQRGGKPSDKQAFVDLLKELKMALEPEGLLLSAAVGAGKDTVDQAYDVPEIIKYLDFINVMTYDFHGTWEPFTGHNAPLHPRPDETPTQQLLNCDFGINYWLELGAPPQMINMGMATYGHNFALADPNNNGLYATTWGPGEPGPFMNAGGTLGYNEVCYELQEGGWTIVRDPYYMAPYAYKGNQWVGYDDPESIGYKCMFANELNLGGGMIWSIETDDFQPLCGPQQFPILRVINEYIRGISTNATAPPPPPTVPYSGPTSDAPQPPPQPPPTDICKYPGFQADPNDCSTFYECIPNVNGGWDVYTYHCSAGTYFDPAINGCDYASNVPDCHAPANSQA